MHRSKFIAVKRPAESPYALLFEKYALAGLVYLYDGRHDHYDREPKRSGRDDDSVVGHGF